MKGATFRGQVRPRTLSGGCVPLASWFLNLSQLLRWPSLCARHYPRRAGQIRTQSRAARPCSIQRRVGINRVEKPLSTLLIWILVSLSPRTWRGCSAGQVAFEEEHAVRAALVDKLLQKIMGKDFGLGCAHGSIVHTGGGLQALHIDQGSEKTRDRLRVPQFSSVVLMSSCGLMADRGSFQWCRCRIRTTRSAPSSSGCIRTSISQTAGP